MALPEAPAARHRAVADRFADLVAGVADWSAPAPVEGWVARDVLAHLIEWLPGLLAAGGAPSWSPGPPVTDDPVAAWAAQQTGVQALLDDPVVSAATFRHEHLPELPLATVIDRFYTADVFMHSFDLARASGQNDVLDADFCAELLAGMRPMEDVLRSSGQYGPAHPVDPGADAQEALIGFIGRDPAWRPQNR